MWRTRYTFMRYIPAWLIPWTVILATGLVGAAHAAPAPTDTTCCKDHPNATLRGLESYQAEKLPAPKVIVNAALWPARLLTGALLSPLATGTYLLGDTDFIDRFESYFVFPEKSAGWYPQVSLGSGTKASAGLVLYYQGRNSRLTLGGRYRNTDIWNLSSRLTWKDISRYGIWKLDLSGRLDSRDDYVFHGFGADPATDARNLFMPGAAEDFGLFTQKLSKLQLVGMLRPSDDWTLTHSVYFQKRETRVTSAGSDPGLDEVFDLTRIPGIAPDQATIGRQVYNELALRFDSRLHEDRIMPGLSLAGYLGLSTGVGGDHSRIGRSGLDAAVYLPVLRDNRVIVPRLILDRMHNLNDDVPIAFTEYPRQRTFRGASTATLLRTDAVSLTPSLEYQWPLTFNLSGHLFVDWLLVSDSLSGLGFDNAPYSAGFGIDLQKDNAELARFSLAGGSEGLRLLFSYGFSRNTNTRTKWR